MEISTNCIKQQEELAVLAAIFEADRVDFDYADLGLVEDKSASDDFAQVSTGWQGRVLVDPPTPVEGVSVSCGDPETNEEGRPEISVQALPPIGLQFLLPPEYPTAATPQLHVTSEWASASLLAELTATADGAAQSCLLTESAALYDAYAAVMRRLAACLAPKQSVHLETHAAFDLVRQNDQAFRAAKPYMCLICLDQQKTATDAVEMPSCRHRFCRDCIVDFFTMLINEGLPRKVRCPHPHCVLAKATEAPAIARSGSVPPTASAASSAVSGSAAKPFSRRRRSKTAKSTGSSSALDPTPDVDQELDLARKLLAFHPIPPDFLLTLLGAELTSKWTDRFLSRLYASDPTMRWCPLPSCGGPARGNLLSSSYAKLATCMRCDFSFCVLCSRAYHGSSQPCKLAEDHVQAVVEQYRAAMEQPEGHERDSKLAPLYAQFGRTMVETVMEKQAAEDRLWDAPDGDYSCFVYREVDAATRAWINENTLACPKCGVRMDYETLWDGACRRVQCLICDVAFCYQCGQEVPERLVNVHYYDPASKCYNLLHHDF